MMPHSAILLACLEITLKFLGSLLLNPVETRRSYIQRIDEHGKLRSHVGFGICSVSRTSCRARSLDALVLGQGRERRRPAIRAPRSSGG